MLAVIFIGLYFLTFVITPNQFKSSFQEAMETFFPGYSVVLGDIKVHPGPIVKITVRHLKVSNHKDTILKTGKIMISYPLSTFFSGRGKVDFTVENPMLSYHENKSSNNWNASIFKNKKPMFFPKSLDHLKINGRASNISIDYIMRDGRVGELVVDRLILKNINQHLNMAFEINSKFLLEPISNERIAFEALMIGHLNLKTFINTGIIETQSLLKFSNIYFESLDLKFPSFDTNIQLRRDEKKNLEGKLKVSFFDKDTLSANFSKQLGRFFLDNLDMTVSLQKVLSLLDYKDKNLDLNDGDLNITGDLLWKKNQHGISSFSPNLQFRATKSLGYKWNNIRTGIDFNGLLLKNKFYLKNKISLLGGFLSSEFTQINESKGKQSIFSNPFVWQIHGENLNIESKAIVHFLSKDSLLDNLRTKIFATNESRGKVLIDWKRSSLDGLEFHGSSTILIGNKQIINENSEFLLGEGRAEMSAITSEKDRFYITKLKLELDSFNISPIMAFLPPAYPQLTGSFDGVISGSYYSGRSEVSERDKNFNFKVDIIGKNGELKSKLLDESFSKAKKSLSKLTARERNKKINISAFNSLRLVGQINPELYNLRNFRFVANQQTYEVNGEGTIFPKNKDKKGNLEFSYSETNGSFSENFKENYGTTDLQINLLQQGTSLVFELDYTLKKIAAHQKSLQKSKKQAKNILPESLSPNKINELIQEAQ